jgi:hypothetical protein
MDICKRQAPPNVAISTDHVAACWLHVDPEQRQASENGLMAAASAGGSLEKDSKKR